MPRRNEPPERARIPTAVAALALALSACGPNASAPAVAGGIDREVFIATYVDLRATTIRSDSFTVSDAERSAVLARHGVTEQQLLEFADLHGRDVEFMRSVWDDVEARLDAERVLPAGTEPVAERAEASSDPAPPPRGRPR